MRVLVGCECSQVVTSAFRAGGHEAFSCDLASCYGSLREYHIQDDLRYAYKYIKPDLFIAHPPCTYLSHAGLCRLVVDGQVDSYRYELGLFARSFFSWCLSRPAPMVCVENPIPIKRFMLPRPTQYVEPYYFGDPYTKTTCLWLRGLPPLQQTKVVRPVGQWVNVHRSQRLRSQTFPGLARAMVSQWGGYLENLQLSLF